MNERHANQIFDNYYNLVVSSGSVEDTATEIFKDIHNLTPDSNDIEEIVDRLHFFFKDSSNGEIYEIIRENDLLDNKHLEDMNRFKENIKKSLAVTDHIKDNMKFLIGFQLSDGDVIDLFRSIL